MTQPVLGILTLYLNDSGLLEERSYYEKMTAEGRKLGIKVIVFTPQEVDSRQTRVYALVYDPDSKLWSRQWHPLPRLIFDRCRIQRSHRFDQLLKFRARYNDLDYLNRPFRNKWVVHNLLSKDGRFKHYLPRTRYVESVQDVREMLQQYQLVYLKPINGTGGRGILRLEKTKSGELLVQGRDHARRIIKPRRIGGDRLNAFLSRWDIKKTRYIVQQGLSLKLDNGRVHDYRMLVQKNSGGEWALTGCAGRIGASRSITANLHGGGRAAKMHDLLKQWIRSDEQIARIKQEIEQFGIGLASYLELCSDALCELAIDFAIDRQGRIWLIEVNPKPAREVFRQAGETEAYRAAIVRPLEYALWKYRNRPNPKNKGGGKKSSGSNKRADEERHAGHEPRETATVADIASVLAEAEPT